MRTVEAITAVDVFSAAGSRSCVVTSSFVVESPSAVFVDKPSSAIEPTYLEVELPVVGEFAVVLPVSASSMLLENVVNSEVICSEIPSSSNISPLPSGSSPKSGMSVMTLCVAVSVRVDAVISPV